MKRYVVISCIDEEEIKSFKTRKEAQKCIRECKQFDKDNGNPFNEVYRIDVEEDEE
jgi:hypothetical protein